MFYFIAFRWSSVTGGDDGLTGWTRLPIDLGFTQIDILGNAEAYYYLVLLIFTVSVGIMALILRSPFGRTLLAIRKNDPPARILGIPLNRHIGLAFVISCLFPILAGALYCLQVIFAYTLPIHFT